MGKELTMISQVILEIHVEIKTFIHGAALPITRKKRIIITLLTSVIFSVVLLLSWKLFSEKIFLMILFGVILFGLILEYFGKR